MKVGRYTVIRATYIVKTDIGWCFYETHRDFKDDIDYRTLIAYNPDSLNSLLAGLNMIKGG